MPLKIYIRIGKIFIGTTNDLMIDKIAC